MKAAKPNAIDIGYVLWNDAHANVSQYSEDMEHAPITMQTVGFILRHDKQGVTLAVETSSQASFRGIHFIPRGMIVRVVVLQKAAVSCWPQVVQLGKRR